MANTDIEKGSEHPIMLRLKNLKKYFPTSRGTVKAVDGISLNVFKGETLACW